MARRLSHVNARGQVKMVDVSAKRATRRTAVARGRLVMARRTLDQLAKDKAPKGNVLATAHLAGVMAAKRTAELIPLAHPLPLDGVDLTFELDTSLPGVQIEAKVRCTGRTGVEMEALTAVSVAALALYDMLKAIDRGMVIERVALWEKRGGTRGVYRRKA